MAKTFEEVQAEIHNATSKPGDKTKTCAESILLRDVVPEPVTWIWPGYLPVGKLVVLDGDPGLGKSTIALDIGARITQGNAMPDGSFSECDSGGVVILSAEDGPADTIRPRFEAAGGDLSKARILTGIRSQDKDGNPALLPPTIEAIEAIRETVKMIDARLVIVDPLMAHLSGETNSNRDQDIRAALNPLVRLADETGVAVLIIRHLNKSKSESSPKYRGGGSIGIIGAARVGLMVLEHEEKKVLTNPKNNLAREAPTLTYDIEGVKVGEVWTSCITWGEAITETAGDILFSQATGERKKKPKLEEAIEFLEEILSGGPVSRTQIALLAEKKGISDAAITRAKTWYDNESDTPIQATKIGKTGPWMWSFEGSQPEDPEGSQNSPSSLSRTDETLLENVVALGELEGSREGEDKRDATLQNEPLFEEVD